MRVAFVGTANAGKTTLINEINKRKLYKNHAVIKEVAGDFSISERQKLETQLAILKHQIAAESGYANFISDRSVIDNYAYFLWHYKKSPQKRNLSGLHADFQVTLDQHLASKPYDAIVLVDEFFPLEDNGIRDLDEKMQTWVFDTLHSLVPLKCEIYHIPFYTISGSTDARIADLDEKLKRFYVQTRLPDFS